MPVGTRSQLKRAKIPDQVETFTKVYKAAENLTQKQKAKFKKVEAQSNEQISKSKNKYSLSSAFEEQTLKNFVTAQMYVGAHCSISGGLANAAKEAASIGAKSFAMFLRNGRSWKLQQLSLQDAEKFKTACKEYNFPSHLILPHGSYLLNCGSPTIETLNKSRETLIHEMQRCEMLGLTLYNFHPGSSCGKMSVEKCIETIAHSINLAHKQTSTVKTVIENMSCQGSTIGGKLDELKAIIERVHDQARMGVCLDTCHAFAAGYDISTEDGLDSFIKSFDELIGLKYLCGIHLNDSKGKLGCHLDRHENIGKGYIGLDGFRNIMNDARLTNLPMILETPNIDYAAEIELLNGLIIK